MYRMDLQGDIGGKRAAVEVQAGGDVILDPTNENVRERNTCKGKMFHL